jgi:hypothetical protein
MFGDPGHRFNNNNRPPDRNDGRRLGIMLIAAGLIVLVGLAMMFVIV